MYPAAKYYRREIMNVLMLLRPKSEVQYVYDNWTLRKGLEKMRSGGYTVMPVLSRDGLYMGSISEGDFLWYLADNGEFRESAKIKDIVRKNWMPAVNVNVSMESLIHSAESQNYIPVTDDWGTFIGLVTRSTIIKTFCSAENSVPASAR